jgi:hypothetical protein
MIVFVVINQRLQMESMMKIRYALLLMMLGVACPAANGTYITLSQESGPGTVSINLGANGSLSGTIGISGINGL